MPEYPLFLAVQQVSAGHFVESVATVADAAEALHRRWNDTYLSILLKMDDRGVLQRLSNDQRARYFNSVALCLFRSGRHDESVRWFVRLRRFSTRVRNNWGIGQSYHNCGIVYFDRDVLSKAETCFRKAIEHTRKTRDHFLLGRSLYDLAMTIAGTSYKTAAILLAESEAVKKRVGDAPGLVGVAHGYAVLALQRKHYDDAVRWFSRAERAAKACGDHHGQGLERFNIGRAYLDLGKYNEASKHFRQAVQVAKEYDLEDVLVRAVGGDALALERQENNRRAEKAFARLFELNMTNGNTTQAVIALHDVGVLVMRQQRYVEARAVFSKAGQLAHRYRLMEWVYRCGSDYAECYFAESEADKGISALRRAAATHERRGLHDVSARLWTDVVSHLIENNASSASINGAVARFLKLAEKVAHAARLKAGVYAELHLWHWGNQEYVAGVKALEEMLESAKCASDDEMAYRAYDQSGVCLQEMGRFEEAVQMHRRALRTARRVRDAAFVERTLNNLGEALRKTHRYAEAIRRLEEAEQIARDRGDHESALSVMHNRALAIEGQTRPHDADTIFRECRDEARRRKIWNEYVRASHALANSAWQRGESRSAEKQYAKALRAADIHKARCRQFMCLNYASALRQMKKPARAIEILSSAAAQLTISPNAHIYHSELAILYNETGDATKAAEQWELARASAMRVENDCALARATDALSQVYNDRGQLETAAKHYEVAVEREMDAELRMTLLLEQMSVLLRLRREKQASQVFDELQKLANGTKGKDVYIESMVMMGDYNWTDGASPQEAVKAHVAAMSACGDSVKQYLEIGTTLTIRLSRVEAISRVRRIAGLRRGVIHWLEHKQEVDLGKQNGALLLWPFSAALRIVNLEGDEVGDDEFNRILQEEVEKACSAGRTSRRRARCASQ